MAEVKISALPNGSTLDGTELVPVVQDGETIQVTTQEIADLSGESFNPESIATNLLYSTTTDPRKLERTRTGGGAAYTEKIELSDGATTVENRKVDSNTRYAQLILEALVGATLYYSSPEGNNRLELLPNVTKILQVARYFSTPTIANDLDIVYKKWVEAGFTLTGALNFAPSVALPSSTNPALGATYSNNVTITGNTTIAGFDNVAEGITRVVKFTGILQLTYNATSLILPSNANITTAVGDIAVFRSLGSGNWECIEYTRRDGTALAGSGSFQTLPTEVTGNLTAAIDKYYINTASATYTDPIGVQGKGFIVLVRGGTATVGGTAYTSGVVYRYYNSGAWSNIMLRDFATITGDVTFSSGVATIANNAVSNAKAAQMAANTIKANNTGSTANASDITTDQLTAMIEQANAVATTGIITGLVSATYKYIRLTSASATGLGSIVAPSSSYKDLYLWNDTGVTLTLYHDYSSEATSANRILCGANRSWANNTMLHLKYDVTEARWCTVAHDGNTFRSLLAGAGTRLVEASSTGQEQAVLTTQDIDFSGAQQTSATSASWTGVNEVTISGLKQGQLYVDVSGGYRYECHVNDKCSRTPIINVAAITTNLIYPCLEVTSTSQPLVSDNAYVANNASQVVFTLPTTATQGDIIIINGKGAGGWEIAQNASQQIVGGATNTTVGTGGYITAGQYAAITLKCITGGASTIWQIVCINPATTLTIV